MMAVHVLMYGSDAWTIKKKDISRIQSAEMKFLRPVKVCTRMGHIRNEEIRTELEMLQFKIKLQNTRSVGLHIYRECTIPDCPNKLFYTNQGEEEMWAVLGRDGQLKTKQETILYPEVMIIIMAITYRD
jgi:hypothetical protein